MYSLISDAWLYDEKRKGDQPCLDSVFDLTSSEVDPRREVRGGDAIEIVLADVDCVKSILETFLVYKIFLRTCHKML